MDQEANATSFTQSAKFPPDYGDFALQCSDNVVCHFPRHLLSYMSGFFRDMFDLPRGDDAGSQTVAPLQLTEPSQTIELLLEHIDPNIQTPEINLDTIVVLLEAAQKYQVPVVTKWFEREIKYERRAVFPEDPSQDLDEPKQQSFLYSHPLLVLHCATLFGLATCGQLALRETSRCDEQLITSTIKYLSFEAYLRGMEIRRARIQLFRTFVKQLALPKTERRYETEWDGTEIEVLVADNKKVCMQCAADRAAWVLKIEHDTEKVPEWNTFINAYESANKVCVQCKGNSWTAHYRSLLDEWRLEAKRMDHQLPDWPFT